MCNYLTAQYSEYFKNNKFIALLLVILIIGVVVAVCVGKEEILPTFFVSLVSLMVVYGSSQDSRNKLRLELFEKRYAIYEELIKFCSHTLQHGAIEEDGIVAAQNSFRGLKYHDSKFLFGDDVNNYFSEINKAFGFLVTYRELINDPYLQDRERILTAYHDYLNKVCDIATKAPILFYPYLYFGDIKSRMKGIA